MRMLLLAFVLPVLLAVPAHAASGTLVGPHGTTAYGDTVTFDVTFTGAKHNQNVRQQIICQDTTTSVVYADVRDLVSSPTVTSFVLGFPEQGTSVWDGSPVSCRADLLLVSPNSHDSVELIAVPVTFAAG